MNLVPGRAGRSKVTLRKRKLRVAHSGGGWERGRKARVHGGREGKGRRVQ